MAVGAPDYERWLDRRTVDELSSALAEPPASAERRRQAFERYQELPVEPNPLYRKYGYFGGVDLTGIDPIGSGAAVPLPARHPEMVRVVHDASGTRIEVPLELQRAGVLAEASAGSAEASPSIAPLGQEPPEDRLTALAIALTNRGLRLRIPDAVRAPVSVEEFTVLSHPRQSISIDREISVGKDARLLFSEQVFSAPNGAEGQRLHASSTRVSLGPRARATVMGLHAPDGRTVSIYRRGATVGAGAKIAWIWCGFGGFRARVRNRTVLDGTGGAADDLQTFFGENKQAYDSAVTLQHIATDTHGQSITRGLFRDEARGMSRGLARIERDARKTLSYLSEHAMLLNRGARSDTIPVLEILCPDVKATHSSSVAPVDPEKVFYLESRGLDLARSIRMIGEGFLSHVWERAPIDGLRETLYPVLSAQWDRTPITWDPPGFPALPPMAGTAGTSDADWRFDTKLR